MLVPVAGLGVFVFLFFYFIVLPVFDYYRDVKGLRRYPNAHPISGITNLWYMLIRRPGTCSKTLLELHHKGNQPVLRIGPNHLSVSNLAAIKDIYGHGTTALKGDMYTDLAGAHRHLADVKDRAKHARKRRMMATAFSQKKVEQWDYKVTDEVLRLLRQFDGRCTAPLPERAAVPSQDLTVDLWPWLNMFTLEAIANIGLSDQLGIIDRGDDRIEGEIGNCTYKASLRDSLHNNARMQHWTCWAQDGGYAIIKAVSSWLPWLWKDGWDGGDNWDGLIHRLARRRYEREQAGEKFDDFFSSMMRDKYGTPHNLPWGEVLAEVSIMMNAGSDTTGINMCSVIYFLCRHPKILRKLREELDSAHAVKPGQVVASYENIKRLPYLRACIDEALRLNPPVCLPLPRSTPPEGGAVLGEYIAGNTNISVPTYVAHRDPSVFKDPEEYKPERWLGEDGKKLQAFFISFSAGARGCIGRNITYLEQSILIATLVSRYEIRLPHAHWELPQYEGFNIWPVELPLKIWRREGTLPLPELSEKH